MGAKRIFRTPEAAEYLGLSVSTLEKKRLDGTGPEFVRLGIRAVGYDVAALDRWIDLRRRRSTSDDRAPDGKVDGDTART